jgi:hypothetical protein
LSCWPSTIVTQRQSVCKRRESFTRVSWLLQAEGPSRTSQAQASARRSHSRATRPAQCRPPEAAQQSSEREQPLRLLQCASWHGTGRCSRCPRHAVLCCDPDTTQRIARSYSSVPAPTALPPPNGLTATTMPCPCSPAAWKGRSATAGLDAWYTLAVPAWGVVPVVSNSIPCSSPTICVVYRSAQHECIQHVHTRSAQHRCFVARGRGSC